MPEHPPPTLTEQVAQLGQTVGQWLAIAFIFCQNAYLHWKRNRNTGALGRIEAQLTANGGSSVKDALLRLEAKIDVLTHEVTLQRSMTRMLADLDDNYVTWVATPAGEWEFLSIGITKLLRVS